MRGAEDHDGARRVGGCICLQVITIGGSGGGRWSFGDDKRQIDARWHDLGIGAISHHSRRFNINMNLFNQFAEGCSGRAPFFHTDSHSQLPSAQ